MATDDNKRVAKNTLILYGRMLLTLSVGIWTSRIILNALGFVDNGLYNVVGGFVGFFSVITNAQANAISRFITFEIGRKNKENLKQIYNTAQLIQIILCLIILILAESIGLWFVNHKLIIPSNRLIAVNLVYQFSIASFILGILSTSQNALIIAYEKMNIYAYVSVISSIAKLIVALIIARSAYDRLIIYSVLLFIISLLTRIFYAVYSYYTFPFCKYGIKGTRTMLKRMFSYAGWSFIGETAGVFRSSGISVILNIFGGPIANTVNGIANQVNALVNMFVTDFTTAFNPQITKKYAAGEYNSLIIYIFRCSKFSFLLMTLIAVPIIFNIEPLLILWLKKVPQETYLFTQLVIVMSLIESVSKPLITAKAATGEIKKYQIIVGGILLLSLPLAYIFLKCSLPIYYSYIALIITSFFAFCARIKLLNGSIPLWSSYKFIRSVIIPMLIVFTLSCCIPLLLKLTTRIEPIAFILLCTLWTFIVVFFVGCNNQERIFIYNTLRRYIIKK